MSLLAIVTAAYLLVVGVGAGIFLWGKPEGNSTLELLLLPAPPYFCEHVADIYGQLACTFAT